MGYPTNKPPLDPPNKKRQAEALQGLVDDRGTSTGDTRDDQRAVTRGNLAAHGTIALTSAYAAGANPTAAEHNALVEDVRALAGLLRALGAGITW